MPRAKKPKPLTVGDITAYVVVDLGTPRARPSPHGTQYYWRARVKGGRRERVGSYWATRTELFRILSAAEAARLEQADTVPAAGAQVINGLEVADLLGYYTAWFDMRPEEDAGERTKVQVAYNCQLLVDYIGEDVLIERMTYPDLEALRDRLLKKYAPKTVRHQLSVFRAAWNWAHRRGLVPKSTFYPGHPRVPDIETRAKVTPSREQLWAIYDQLVAHAAKYKRVHWVPLYYLVTMGTGGRPKEIDILDWADIHEDEATPWIALDGKTGPRQVVIDDALAERLAAERRARDRVGPGPMWPVQYPAVAVRKQMLQLDWEAIGCPQTSLYALRRNASRELYESGASPVVEAAQLGHSAITALRYYAKARESDQRRAAVAAALGRREGPIVASLDVQRAKRDGE